MGEKLVMEQHLKFNHVTLIHVKVFLFVGQNKPSLLKRLRRITLLQLIRYYTNHFFVETELKCLDSNGLKKDKYGLGCISTVGSACGKHDDNDFNSTTMCCVCGGGIYVPKDGKCLIIRPYILHILILFSNDIFSVSL